MQPENLSVARFEEFTSECLYFFSLRRQQRSPHGEVVGNRNGSGGAAPQPCFPPRVAFFLRAKHRSDILSQLSNILKTISGLRTGGAYRNQRFGSETGIGTRNLGGILGGETPKSRAGAPRCADPPPPKANRVQEAVLMDADLFLLLFHLSPSALNFPSPSLSPASPTTQQLQKGRDTKRPESEIWDSHTKLFQLIPSLNFPFLHQIELGRGCPPGLHSRRPQPSPPRPRNTCGAICGATPSTGARHMILAAPGLPEFHLNYYYYYLQLWFQGLFATLQ